MTAHASPSLPDDVRLSLWRIFGPGTSPLKGRAPHELAAGVVKGLRSQDREAQAELRAEIEGWFIAAGDCRLLASEHRNHVAEAIVDGVGAQQVMRDTAIWALGAIEASVVAPLVVARWQPRRIETFINDAITQLEIACQRDEVLDARRAGVSKGEGADTRIPRDAVMRDTLLETFDHLERFGFDLVHMGVHRGISNLVELVLELQPRRLAEVVRRLDHPVVQMLAVETVVHLARRQDHRCTLAWFHNDAPDGLIALAVLETLRTVCALDGDAEVPGKPWEPHHHWRTELRPPTDDLNAAAKKLLEDLLDALAVLPGEAAPRWIAGAVAYGARILSRDPDQQLSAQVQQFEAAALVRLVAIAQRGWGEAMTEALLAGAPGLWNKRLLAQLAWELRTTTPKLAVSLAARPLVDFAEDIKAEMARGFYHVQWSFWTFRDWTGSLGLCLALTGKTDDIVAWVRSAAASLPLTTWAAEEQIGAFMAASTVVKHLMLVAWHGAHAAKATGLPVADAKLRALAELFWDHCAFALTYLGDEPQRSVAAEYVTRSLVALGLVGPELLLACAERRGVGPRALLGMLEQEDLVDTLDDQMRGALIEIAQPLFGTGEGLGSETLEWWGRVWLLLEAPTLAVATARWMTASRMFVRSRSMQVLALQLWVLGLRNGLEVDRSSLCERFYTLWPSRHAADEERQVRNEVEAELWELGVLSRVRM